MADEDLTLDTRMTVRLRSDVFEAFNRKLAAELDYPQAVFFRHVVEAFLEDRLTIKRKKDNLYE